MQLAYDRDQNVLKVALSANQTACTTREIRPGVVDVVEGGRLLGVEISSADNVDKLTRRFRTWLQDNLAGDYIAIYEDGSVYIELSDQVTSVVVRSSDILVTLELDSKDRITAISFPRRAPGYEISYPSGNR